MRRIYAEQRGATGDTEHNKFFELIDDDSKVISRWGPIGAAKPSEKVLIESPDAAIRKKAFDKKFKEKCQRKDNPYVVVEDGGLRVEDRPSEAGRRWGLEVETHSRLSIQEVAAKMRERDLEVNVDTGRYFKSNGRVWDVKRDGSCGFEFASPILSGDAGIFDAKIACDKIKEVCPTPVNSSCGIHVTIDVSDHSEKDLCRLIIAYLKAQEHFYAECNESRQNNRYCLRNPVQALQSTSNYHSFSWLFGAVDGSNRYHGLNLSRLREKKIIEFRMLESSVSSRKVGAWIRMCVGFVDGVLKSKAHFKTGAQFSEETFRAICEGTWSVC